MLDDLLAQQPTPIPTEGVPWWATALLSALGILVTAGVTILTRRSPPGEAKPETPPPDPKPGLTVPALGIQPLPTTADGQLEMAKAYVAELARDRDETKAELIEARRTVERLERRVHDQDMLIERLQALLGMGQTPPMPRPPGWPPSQGQQ